MTDPKEKPAEQAEDENKIEEPGQKNGTNWDENQRIDEEGNELDPQDIK